MKLNMVAKRAKKKNVVREQKERKKAWHELLLNAVRTKSEHSENDFMSRYIKNELEQGTIYREGVIRIKNKDIL